MLRTPCRRGPLILSLQSVGLQKYVRPILARQLLCTSQKSLLDQFKSTTGSRESKTQEGDGQAKEAKWKSVFKLGAVGHTEVIPPPAGNSAEDVQNGKEIGGVWMSLQSRMESSLNEVPVESPEAEYAKNGTNGTKDASDTTDTTDTTAAECEDHTSTDSTPPKKGGRSKSKCKTKARREAKKNGQARLKSQPIDHRSGAKNTEEDTTDISAAESADQTPTDSTPQKKGGKTSKLKRKANDELEVKTIRPSRLHLKALDDQTTRKAPELCYNLNRVLFNPGVYHMQDHRSGVFNFDPYLASIMPVEEFDFDVLKDYITSSKDTKLRELCAQHGLKYCGSTSSMTSILSHFHFLLSNWRLPNFSNLSKSLKPDSQNFTGLTRGPAAAFAHFKDGVYAIDADKEYDTENVLSMLGKSMEKLLTLPKEEFEKYRRSRSHQLSDDEKNADETYHFTTLGDFMMRSQLDAYDPRLPGSGVFDLKTRAVISIRMDVTGYEKGVGYEIRERFGQWESFEREYCDMIRAAFLKYSLQVRMGRMDGIFVAFHNTQRIFGFQYISLAEMDHAIHGTNDTRLGDQEFKCSVRLLNDLLDRATKRFPGRTLRLHIETRPTKVPLTYFFAEPVSEEEMRMTQEAGKPSLEQVEREIQGLSQEEREVESAQEAEAAQMEKLDTEKSESESESESESDKGGPDNLSVNDPQNENTWKEMMSKVDEAVENESLGVGSIRDAVQEALEHSGLLQDKTELESEKYVDDLVLALTAHSTEAKELGESHVSKDVDAGHDDSMDNTTLANLILKVTQGVNEKNPNLRTFERKVADLASQSKKSDLDSVHNDNDQATESPSAGGDGGGELETLESAAIEAQKDEAQKDEAQKDEAQKDEAQKDEVQTDEVQTDEAQTDEAQTDEVQTDEAQTDEAQTDEAQKDEAQKDEAQKESNATEEPERELLGMYVSIRNRVNGEFVPRPGRLGKSFDWAVEYTVTELPDTRARTIYEKIKRRRREVLNTDPSARSAEWYHMFKGQLPIVTKQGERYREMKRRQEAGNPVYVAWDTKPLPPDTAGQTNA